jgi:F-box/WD-40 domain protein 7
MSVRALVQEFLHSSKEPPAAIHDEKGCNEYFYDEYELYSIDSVTSVQHLPNEVLVLIFSFLEVKELISVALICHHWRRLTEEELIWKNLVYKHISSTALINRLLKRTTVSASRKDSDRATGTGRWKSVFYTKHQTKKNWQRGSFTTTVLPPQHSAAIFCLSMEDDVIVTGSSDRTLTVWNADTGTAVRKLEGQHQYAIWCVKLLAQQNMVLSASYDASICLWNLSAGKCIKKLFGHTSAIWGLDSIAGKIASGSTDTTLRIWDIEVGETTSTIEAMQDTVWCCQFTDPNTLVSGGTNVRIWDLRIGECVETLVGHKDGIRCIQADDHIIVSGSYDATAKVWDRATHSVVTEFNGHEDSITTLQYDSSGMLVTSSFDASFRVWNINDGSAVTAWGKSITNNTESGEATANEGGKVYCLRFDETRLVNGREDSHLRIQDFANANL